MKKVVLASMLLFFVLTFASCAAKNVSTSKSASTNIKFEYFYRGFATLNDNNEVDTYQKDPLIIQTDEDWHDFMDKYIPGIPYYTEVDFSKECLVFNPLFPAKPFYSIAADIKTFVVNGNKLEPEYVENGPIGVANGIYAQNIEGITHCFVNIVKMSKSDIPKGIQNIYHKKSESDIREIAYQSLGGSIKGTIIDWEDGKVEECKYSNDHRIGSQNGLVNIKGIDTYKVTFRNNKEGVLGPIIIYIDKNSYVVLGGDLRD